MGSCAGCCCGACSAAPLLPLLPAPPPPAPSPPRTATAASSIRENVPTANPFIPGSTVQIGQQRAQGVELDLAWEPTPSFSLLFAYAYTDAIVTEDVVNKVATVGQNIDRIGKKLPRVPEHSGRLAARYRFREGALKGLDLSNGNHVKHPLGSQVDNRNLLLHAHG
jgi:iron complex outermembrane receptor protein